MSRDRVGDGPRPGRRPHATRSEVARDPVGRSAGPGRSECLTRSGAAFDPVRAHYPPEGEEFLNEPCRTGRAVGVGRQQGTGGKDIVTPGGKGAFTPG